MEWMKSYLTGRKMKTMVRGVSSEWAEVVSGVPQGSVLAPLMFLIYINDLPDGVRSYVNMFADDAKMMRQVKNQEDCQDLQKDLDVIQEWSDKWMMEFNADKCHVLEMGRSMHRPHARYNLGGVELKSADKEKDLGVVVQSNLSPEGHINKVVGEGLAIVANIRTTFTHLDEKLIKKVIESILRPKLEYAQVVWAPPLKKHMRKFTSRKQRNPPSNKSDHAVIILAPLMRGPARRGEAALTFTSGLVSYTKNKGTVADATSERSCIQTDM